MKILVIFFVSCLLWISILFFIPKSETGQYRVYDCGMAEWHPDIPIEVKEACRKRFLEK